MRPAPAVGPVSTRVDPHSLRGTGARLEREEPEKAAHDDRPTHVFGPAGNLVGSDFNTA